MNETNQAKYVDGAKKLAHTQPKERGRQRAELAQILADAILARPVPSRPYPLLFLCTHNSRRSQMAQAWAQLAADQYELPVRAYSAGTEVTACHPNSITALTRGGFRLEGRGSGENPRYELVSEDGITRTTLWSKRYDDPSLPSQKGGMIMTCGHAEKHCPVLPRAGFRFGLCYTDPKSGDGTDEEAEIYDVTSRLICGEMFGVLKQVAETIKPSVRKHHP